MPAQIRTNKLQPVPKGPSLLKSQYVFIIRDDIYLKEFPKIYQSLY